MDDLDPSAQSPSPILFGADGLRAGWSILFFLAFFLGIGYPLQYAVARAARLPLHGDTYAGSATIDRAPIPTILPELTGCVTVLIATFLMGRIEGRPIAAYGFKPFRGNAYLLQGLAWGFACLSLLVAVLTLLHLLRFTGIMLQPESALRYGLIWALGFASVAGLGEFLLRGFLLVTLARGLSGLIGAVWTTNHRRATGFWIAALILSFIFGFGHSSNPGESPLGVLAAGLIGFVFCFAIYRTGSLWWAFGFHTAWDWAQSFVYGVPDSGYMFQGHLLTALPAGAPLLSGGITGPEGSLFVLPVFIVIATIIHVTLPRGARAVLSL